MDNADEQGRNRPRKTARPLDRARLNELALAYVARFATSGGRLSAYLARKIRERGWDDEVPPDVAALVETMVGRGYVDDAGFALARGAGMMRRGFGARRGGLGLPALRRGVGGARIAAVGCSAGARAGYGGSSCRGD